MDDLPDFEIEFVPVEPVRRSWKPDEKVVVLDADGKPKGWIPMGEYMSPEGGKLRKFHE